MFFLFFNFPSHLFYSSAWPDIRRLAVLRRRSSTVAAALCVPTAEALVGTEYERTLRRYQGLGLPTFDLQPLLETTTADGSERRSVEQPSRSERKRSGTAFSPARKRRMTDSSASAAEVRDYPWRARPTNDTKARIARALSQRLYLISQSKSKGDPGPVRVFKVLGSTGNVYTVRIARTVSCTCPDADRGNLCKHICFVMLRVLRLPRDSPLVYQRALLPSEREGIFADMPAVGQDVAASETVRAAYQQATGKAHPKAAAAAAEPLAPRGGAEGDCPICFEPLGTEQVKTCTICRNGIHAECFGRWARASAGTTPTCPFCRTPWVDPEAPAKAPARNGGYINLAQQAGLPAARESAYREWDFHDDDLW